MTPETALELQRMETNAWRNEALKSREHLAAANRVILVYAAWMARYRVWWKERNAL